MSTQPGWKAEQVNAAQCFGCGLDTPRSDIKKVIVGVVPDENPESTPRWLVHLLCPPCAERMYDQWSNREIEREG